MEKWLVGNASVIGAGHTKTGLPCQDASVIKTNQSGDWLIAVVCDGAGTAKRADEGANYLTTTFASELNNISLKLNSTPPGSWVSDHIIKVILETRSYFRYQAGEESITDFNCTLVACLIGNNGGFSIHIGDGAIFGRKVNASHSSGKGEPFVDFLSPPENGEYANETYFVTENDWIKHLRITPMPALNWVILCTDGGAALSMKNEQVPKSGFVSPILEQIFSANDSQQRNKYLERLLADPRADGVTGDDKTLAVAIRNDSSTRENYSGLIHFDEPAPPITDEPAPPITDEPAPEPRSLEKFENMQSVMPRSRHIFQIGKFSLKTWKIGKFSLKTWQIFIALAGLFLIVFLINPDSDPKKEKEKQAVQSLQNSTQKNKKNKEISPATAITLTEPSKAAPQNSTKPVPEESEVPKSNKDQSVGESQKKEKEKQAVQSLQNSTQKNKKNKEISPATAITLTEPSKAAPQNSTKPVPEESEVPKSNEDQSVGESQKKEKEKQAVQSLQNSTQKNKKNKEISPATAITLTEPSKAAPQNSTKPVPEESEVPKSNKDQSVGESQTKKSDARNEPTNSKN